MTAILAEDKPNPAAIDRYLFPLELDDPLRKPASAIMRRASTALSMAVTGERLRDWFRYLRNQGLDSLAVSMDDVNAYLWLKQHLSPVTQRTQLTAVRVLYDEAIVRDLITKNPTRGVKLGQYTAAEVHSLSLEASQAIIDAVRSELNDPELRLVAARDYLLFALLMTMGPRSKEIRRLTFSDFSQTGERLVVHIFGKNRKHADLAASPLVVEALSLYRSVLDEHQVAIEESDAICLPLGGRFRPEAGVHPSSPRAPMSDRALYNIVRSRLDHVGVVGAKVGPHRLRKTFATLAWRAGADPVAIQRGLGHRHLRTTLDHYISPEQDLDHPASDRVPLAPAGLAPKQPKQ